MQSTEAVRWLVWEEKERTFQIKHASNGKEGIVRGNLKVGGFYKNEDTGEEHVWEYQGCFYHGCRSCFRINREKALHNDPFNTMNTRYENTMVKLKKLKELGFVVHVMWGCKWRRTMKNNENIAEYLKKHPMCRKDPINPRDALYGGRTNAVKLHYKVKKGEKIKYLDVCSLYPYCCKVKKIPRGSSKKYLCR